ncbi:glycerol-3-phosphate cytidylyltransferase [bacterium]|nr:glycerol-3-phosphate cytidylyltransferase [bacterium]
MIKEKTKAQRIGITCSTFDLFHAGHIVMLEEAKRQCDWLIAAIQVDPTLDRPGKKNKPVQSIIERQIQVSACRYVDEIIVYSTEKELEDIFLTFPLDVRILGEEYSSTNYTGKAICINRGIEIYFNKRDHYFSSTDLRTRVFEAELARRGAKWEETNTSNVSNVMPSLK